MGSYVEDLILNSGYTDKESNGIFYPARRSSEIWERVEGGFICYMPQPATFGQTEDGSPVRAWGVMTDKGVKTPYTLKQEYKHLAIAGLHPIDQPEMFEWVWPDSRIIEIYEHATPLGADSPSWIKTTDELGINHFEKADS